MAATGDDSRRELVTRLPLPLAQLYNRARNAKTPLDRHSYAFYLWEAAIRLLGSVAVVEYAAQIESGQSIERQHLPSLSTSSFAIWADQIERLAPTLASVDDASFRQICEFVGFPRDDLPNVAQCDAALCRELDVPIGSTVVDLFQTFRRLVRYRNSILGHGVDNMKSGDFYATMGGLLLAAGEELLEHLDVLAGRRLVYLARAERSESTISADEAVMHFDRFELIGNAPVCLQPLELSARNGGSSSLSNGLYLQGQPSSARTINLLDNAGLLPLSPLTHFDAESGEFFFLTAAVAFPR